MRCEQLVGVESCGRGGWSGTGVTHVNEGKEGQVEVRCQAIPASWHKQAPKDSEELIGGQCCHLAQQPLWSLPRVPAVVKTAWPTSAGGWTTPSKSAF